MENTERYPQRADSFLPLVEENGAIVPDLSQLDFSKFPPFTQGAAFLFLQKLLSSLVLTLTCLGSWGNNRQYSKSRKFTGCWSTAPNFRRNSGYAVGLDRLGEVSLADFEPLKWQSVEDIVLAIPQLRDLPLGDVLPIFDRLLQEDGSLVNLAGTLIGEVIDNPQFEQLIDVALGDIDLSSYTIDAIPFLSGMRLENLKDWQAVVIAGIPGLGSFPWSEFPNPLSSVGLVALFDIAYGEKEARRLNTITGSDVEGFAVPCEKDSCPYIELSGPPWLNATPYTVSSGLLDLPRWYAVVVVY